MNVHKHFFYSAIAFIAFPKTRATSFSSRERTKEVFQPKLKHVLKCDDLRLGDKRQSTPQFDYQTSSEVFYSRLRFSSGLLWKSIGLKIEYQQHGKIRSRSIGKQYFIASVSIGSKITLFMDSSKQTQYWDGRNFLIILDGADLPTNSIACGLKVDNAAYTCSLNLNILSK